MVKRYVRFTAITSLAIALSLFASGCSQKTVKVDAGSDSATTESTEVQGVERSSPPMGSEESLSSQAQAQKSRLTILEGRTTGPMLPIYFDFDKSSIKKDQKGRLEKNARYLKDNATARIAIEGNCDERGTNEYNMALGERRAISAKKYLLNLGVASNRISTISFGEEKPLNRGHDDLAWSQNRRDDFVEKQ